MFLEKYLALSKSRYPSASEFHDLAERLAPVASDAVIELPRSLWPRVQKVVRDIYSFAHRPEFKTRLLTTASPLEAQILNGPARNSSVLMAYDFHYTADDDRLSLIEVNTNASAYLFADLLYRTEPVATPWGDPLTALQSSFAAELKAAGFQGSVRGSPRAAIIDENIEQQKMRVEFAMYRDIFKSWGWAPEIVEARDVKPDDFDFVYNRHTDFLFAQTAHLLDAYLGGRPIFSPHPKEYLLLAAKDRLVDFSAAGLAPDVILPVVLLNAQTDVEKTWAERKKLFFKPARAFGAKGAYRGASISRKFFNEIVTKEYLAQEFRPPGSHGDWKFDLRFYTYQDEIHLGVARLYQGQVTNMSQVGGGLARLRFS